MTISRGSVRLQVTFSDADIWEGDTVADKDPWVSGAPSARQEIDKQVLAPSRLPQGILDRLLAASPGACPAPACRVVRDCAALGF
jgi:hypothetical protein